MPPPNLHQSPKPVLPLQLSISDFLKLCLPLAKNSFFQPENLFLIQQGILLLLNVNRVESDLKPDFKR